MSKEEFNAVVMTEVEDKARALQRNYPKLFQNGLWVSMDNATFHPTGELKLRVRGLRVHRLPVPPQSHDIHKVIEHAIHLLKMEFDKWMIDHPDVVKMEDIKAAFVRTFYEKVKRDGVRKDIMSLRKTYRAIYRSVKAGGTEGDWAPSRLR